MAPRLCLVHEEMMKSEREPRRGQSGGWTLSVGCAKGGKAVLHPNPCVVLGAVEYAIRKATCSGCVLVKEREREGGRQAATRSRIGEEALRRCACVTSEVCACAAQQELSSP